MIPTTQHSRRGKAMDTMKRTVVSLEQGKDVQEEQEDFQGSKNTVYEIMSPCMSLNTCLYS